MNFSIPQGSVQGTFLFLAYASTIQEVVKKDLTLTGFADDHSICKQFKSGTRQEQNTIAVLESSLKNIKAWMDAVRLKLNESKTKFIYFGSEQQLLKCSENTIRVINEIIDRCSTVWYLGGYLDWQLNFKEHIKTKCKSATWTTSWRYPKPIGKHLHCKPSVYTDQEHGMHYQKNCEEQTTISTINYDRFRKDLKTHFFLQAYT